MKQPQPIIAVVGVKDIIPYREVIKTLDMAHDEVQLSPKLVEISRQSKGILTQGYRYYHRFSW